MNEHAGAAAPQLSRATYRLTSVPVAGGELAVGAWGDGGPLVVAVHGITASHRSWALVAQELAGDHRFVAPDLRGRGGSRNLPEPYGMSAHADDIAAVIAHHGGLADVLIGHSMGGFVAVETVRRYPGLVSRLVLVDGGAPLPLPPGGHSAAEAEAAIAAALGPAFARLSMTFPSREAYRQMWREHPSFVEWNDAMADYADYDLVGEEPELRPSCRVEAAVRDARDLYAYEGIEPAALAVPAIFLRAERGMFNTAPLYPDGDASRWLPGVEEHTVNGVNHYTITLGPAGARAAVEAVRAGSGLSRMPAAGSG